MAGALALAGAVRVQAGRPRFAPLDAALRARLQEQRQFVERLVARHFPGERLTRSRADIALLQRVVDARVVPRTDGWGLQALGVAYGDALAAVVPGLAWVRVVDAYGTDPTLRLRGTSVQVNALTMISKRVEQGEPVDLEAIARDVARFCGRQP